MTRHANEPTTTRTLDRRQRLALRRGRVRRVVVLFVVIASGLFGVRAASAYFQATGSGSGSASSGALQSPTLTATGTVTSQLLPGGTADLHFVVVNPNSYPVTITGIAQTALSSIGVSGSLGACTSATAGVSVSVAQPSLPLTITAVNGGSQTVDLSGGASMSSSSATGCQQASFSIPVTVTVRTS